jgi:hypothetical protein
MLADQKRIAVCAGGNQSLPIAIKKIADCACTACATALKSLKKADARATAIQVLP